MLFFEPSNLWVALQKFLFYLYGNLLHVPYKNSSLTARKIVRIYYVQIFLSK